MVLIFPHKNLVGQCKLDVEKEGEEERECFAGTFWIPNRELSAKWFSGFRGKYGVKEFTDPPPPSKLFKSLPVIPKYGWYVPPI